MWMAGSVSWAPRHPRAKQWRVGVSPPQSVTPDSDDRLAAVVPRAIMTGMVDKGGRSGPRSGRERIQKLAQAALNADLTVEQVDTLLVDLGETLIDLNKSTASLDATLERFNDTISRIDELAPRLTGMVERLEAIVDRVERIVGAGETAVAPLAATENAMRNLVRAIRQRAGL
jgi:hypothetical protein